MVSVQARKEHFFTLGFEPKELGLRNNDDKALSFISSSCLGEKEVITAFLRQTIKDLTIHTYIRPWFLKSSSSNFSMTFVEKSSAFRVHNFFVHRIIEILLHKQVYEFVLVKQTNFNISK